jgi:cytochrome c oxidase assembly factor CtaG
MFETAISSWTWNPWMIVIFSFLAWIYFRGWIHLHQYLPRHFSKWRLVSFLTGQLLLFTAIASPLDAFSGMLLTVHMIQHLLLMMVVPPLLLMGSPFLPILRGMPKRFLKDGLGPFLSWPALQRLGHFLTHPLVCLLSFMLSNIIWHIPASYELALRSKFWHDIQHICFFTTAILFWWPVIQPWPSRPRWPRWTTIPYMLIADLQNTALSAFLIFYDRILYPTYAASPRLFGLSALEDQVAAGSIMWVPGSFSFLMPVGWIVIQILSSKRAVVRPSTMGSVDLKFRLPQAEARKDPRLWDLLKTPVLGIVMRQRYFRRLAQLVMFGLAVLVTADGFLGPQMSPMNLAGSVPWIHWRGLLVIVLLVAGNFFCMACPFMLTRDLGKRLLPARFRWPKLLRSKWLAVVLLAVYLWAYEAFSLWDSPALTAWIIVGYFVTSFLVDGFFKGASFCKYVCPIGQYNFVQSLVSPLEVKVRDVNVCRNCRTYDCIRGNAYEKGCELQLFQPKKSGNMDCTFCMDCIHACPHQNVGILTVLPTSDLWYDRYRSSIGRLSRRPDIALLILLLVFGAFLNAAGMLQSVSTWEKRLLDSFSLHSLRIMLAILFVFFLLILPAFLAGICGAISRIFTDGAIRWKELTCSLVVALVPLGFSMWIAHYSYHLLTGANTIVPVFQRFLSDAGFSLFGNSDWTTGSLVRIDSLPSFQILLLDLGLLFTLYIGWRISLRYANRRARALGLLMPWASLAAALYIVGVWIVLQPMEMRGMMIH